jgi:leucyl aminopeptidase
MDVMKSDMAGAAAVAGAIYLAALQKLNVHVIGLIPATDNRPGQNAYAPGDIITMFNGSTVEVLNTDAEGRMILADALVLFSEIQTRACGQRSNIDWSCHACNRYQSDCSDGQCG